MPSAPQPLDEFQKYNMTLERRTRQFAEQVIHRMYSARGGVGFVHSAAAAFPVGASSDGPRQCLPVAHYHARANCTICEIASCVGLANMELGSERIAPAVSRQVAVRPLVRSMDVKSHYG